MKSYDFKSAGLKAPAHRVDPPAGPADVSAIVALAAAQYPESLAMVEGDRRWLYGELSAAVDAAAGLFQSLGLSPGDRVAACMTNRADIVIGFFAAMRVGAVWVGINRILPTADKQYILAHSATRLLLADAVAAAELAALPAALPALDGILNIDEDGAWDRARKGEGTQGFRPVEIDAYAPATIMYTSGTTGTPKGVVHSQHNMVTVAAATSWHGLMQPEGTRGAVLPLTITNIMILGPLLAFWNKRPFSIGPSARIEPFVEWLNRDQVSQVAFVPTMVYDLMQADLDLPPCTVAGSGGAPISRKLRDRFLDRHGYELHTSYGLTEAPTVVAISNGLRGADDASGLPLPHLQVSVRDADGRELPQGETGEVCIAPVSEGPWANVYAPPLGYWQDSERTAALLKGGVMHTGDVGFLDAAGWLTICDRSSDLILRGGSNVYPAEIERVISQRPGVADCGVVGQPDERLGQMTVAFVQRTSPDLDALALQEDLQSACAQALSRYKIPDKWVVVDELPRNAMGKVVKTRLRDRPA